jgi:hypothetical protein
MRSTRRHYRNGSGQNRVGSNLGSWRCLNEGKGYEMICGARLGIRNPMTKLKPTTSHLALCVFCGVNAGVTREGFRLRLQLSSREVPF